MMVSTKLYTAIFVSSNETRVKNVHAGHNCDEAYDSIKLEAAEGESLVALVPGSHAHWSHVYKPQTDTRINKVSHVDPFEMPDDYDTDRSYHRFG